MDYSITDNKTVAIKEIMPKKQEYERILVMFIF